MTKKYLIKYSLEFLIIVLGITVSFWINQAANTSEFETQKLKIINNLQIEIDQIYNYCLERKDACKKDVDILKLFIVIGDLERGYGLHLSFHFQKNKEDSFEAHLLLGFHLQ